MSLAFLIGIQNVPEGIVSYREMMTGKTAFAIILAVSAGGIFYMLYFVLQSLS
ncbi:MAG: hypothetical protein ACRD8W_29610 [Nitrososphaeraceae archaeon]